MFLCSIPLAHTRNELQKAYNEGIRKLWVLNSGAMKPLEQEIEFFLRLAWEIGSENALTEDVDAYVADWIDRNFEVGIGKEVSALLNDFSQLTNVRKLENMDYDAFSQTAYGDEAVVRIHKYEELFTRGNAIYEALPEKEKDAFFQLVLMRIHAGYLSLIHIYRHAGVQALPQRDSLRGGRIRRQLYPGNDRLLPPGNAGGGEHRHCGYCAVLYFLAGRRGAGKIIGLYGRLSALGARVRPEFLFMHSVEMGITVKACVGAGFQQGLPFFVQLVCQ